jgi:glutaredoxin
LKTEETMNTPRRFAIAIAMIALVPALAQAQSVYRWVDKSGKVHYSDQPPPEEVKNVQQKRMGGGASAEVSQLPYATQIAMQKSPAVLYGAPTCGAPCDQGRALLTKRGIPFTERNASASEADAEALRKLVGALQVPVLTLGANTLKGYDEGNWNSALDAAGYPRTVLPGQRPPVPTKPPAPPAQPAPPATQAAPAAAADAPK